MRTVTATRYSRRCARDFLPGALTFAPAVDPTPRAELAAEIMWFDALITNIDRTPRNPNMLTWHDRPWLIDHGAALSASTGWSHRASRWSSPHPSTRA